MVGEFVQEYVFQLLVVEAGKESRRQQDGGDDWGRMEAGTTHQ